MWPRTETTNVSGSGLLCQPQTCLAISFRGGNGETRENNQAVAGRKIAERINLFPAATAQNAAAEKKQGDVRTQAAASFCRAGKSRRSPVNRSRPRIVAAALVLAPPSPLPSGITLAI